MFWPRKRDPVTEAPAPAPADASRMRQENEHLKQEARRYATIINLSANPVWQRDLALNITYCNLAFSEVAEQTAEHVMAVGDLELYRGHRELARRALASGQEQSERRHIVVNGQRRLYLIREVPMPGEGVVGYASHLSELDTLQQQLEQHLQAQRDLMESSTSAMAVYGRDQRLMMYNFAYSALWKLDEAWLDGKPTYGEVLELMRERRLLPEQANFKAFKQARLKLFTGLIEPQEEFFYLPDGKTLRVVAIPHALGGILFVYEDVTDRLALERSYNTLIAVQRETLDNLHEGVALFAENGRLKLSNPAFRRLWSLETEFTLGEPHLREVLERCQGFFRTDNWPQFLNRLLTRFQQRELTALTFERSDGRVLNCSTVPLPDGATLLSFIDVTDSTLVERSLRDRARALETADRVKTEFLANMSYELRSPLTSISGFAQMLAREYGGALNVTQRDYVQGIYDSAQHLAALISDIIDLATVEAGYLTLNPREFEVRAALETVVSLLATRLRTQQTQIEIDVAPRAARMIADEVRVKQIVMNLLSHMIRYVKGRGTIRVAAVSLPEYFDLVLTDTSSSLNIAQLRAALELDGGGDKPLASDAMLGLNLVRRFMALHHGRVVVQDDAGDGVAVHCQFPLTADAQIGERIPDLLERRG